MLETTSPSTTFLAVRFLLFGFDPIKEREVRAKLLSGGGVDAGQYGQNCTHVIVDKILFDDPLCVAARNDGKTLVTGLWVDHSYDIGMAVDATSIMYRPLRDLNGIEGAERLLVCLTGYQRQDRDDIMTMVGLMGAQFSKPLVANKVTHLICYKFEGEKYELAKKLKKIKLVNHRWLEDCLRDWELLPEDNYSKSGYELEAMEAEAKDSEEEAEGPTLKQSSHEMSNRSPHLRMGTPKSCQMPKLTGELPKMACNLSEPEGMPSVDNGKDMLVTPSRKNRSASGFISNFVSEASPCRVSGASNDAPSVGLHNPQERTPNSTKGGSDLETISGSAERPYSDAKFSARSYTRKTPRTSPISTFSGKLGNTRGSPKVQLGESIDKSSAKFESAKDLTGSGHVEVLPRTTELFHEEASSSKKQKMDVSCFNPKSHDMGHEPPRSVTGSPSVSCNQGLEQPHLVDGLSKINNQHPDVTGSPLVSLDAAAQKSHSDISIGKASNFKTKQLMQDLLPLEDAASEDERKRDVDENMPQTSLKALKNSSLASKPEVGDFGVKKSEDLVADVEVLCHQQQDRQVPSPFNRNSEGEKSQTIANLEGLEEGNGNLMTKRGRTKMIAKKTLGSGPKLKSSANLKGSIYLNKVAAQSDPAVGLPREIAEHENFSSFNELETSPATVNVIAVKEVETKIDTKSGDNTENASTVMDDETEPPEDKDTHEGVPDEEKDGVVDLSSKADDNTKVKPDVPQHSTNNTTADMDDGAKEDKSAVQSQQKDKTTCKANGTKGKVRQGKKQPSGKSKTKTVLTLSGHAKSKQASDGEKTCNGEDIVEKVMGEEKGKPCSAGQTKSRTISKRKTENSIEVNKENKPIVDGDQNISQFKGHVRKTALKSDNVSMKVKQKSRKRDPNCVLVREVSKQLETEHIWFILSGHKLQRKEFQQVIRRLKGKVCRDSHQWSYQATHFIAPDPIRRTEKFFAAAASGRWILKTDYLAACSQAGRFLGEEPYEWHKHGLSEDGAINLEAPRKWRLLREKTGHGAFYGMRVIIYGECIAPSLDTLKRVVKAGDGTILATSPPYTRFLSSGVDYAIVSPGMPRVDLWVQEFMRHEIPCIVADYLVEYVCKPGYSLERHVLYNTQAWAEKSFANLLSKAEDIVEDLTPSDDCGNDDTACKVCGSHDRGEVMLICGDESGSVGCGIGMHIDCCDPPLENIPEEDWFCPNCSNSNSNSSPKRRKGA